MSSNEDFSGANVLFGTADVEETAATKLAAQTINLTTPVTARYMRIWQKGHCIQNTNSSWKGYSNGVGLREIEVIAKLKDGKQDDNYAVHNSTGERWLQFEYKNRYRIHEGSSRGAYPLVRIGVSSTPTSVGTDVDGMHSRPMFPILETQVGDGWVGDVDYTKQATKQATKQDSNFLVDWVRVYQSEGQPDAFRRPGRRRERRVPDRPRLTDRGADSSEQRRRRLAEQEQLLLRRTAAV